MLWKSASYGICFLPYTTCSKRKPKGPLCRVRGSIRRIACRPLAIQANLLLVEDANDVAADFDELIWGFFNLCQSTQVLKLVSSLVVHRRLPHRRNPCLTPAPTENLFSA